MNTGEAQLKIIPTQLPDIWSTVNQAGLSIKDLPFLVIDPPSPTTPPTSESEPEASKRKRRQFKRSPFTVEQKQILFGWLNRQRKHPYPTSSEKEQLMELTGLSRDQINVWFTNHRIRQGLSNSSYHSSIRAKKLKAALDAQATSTH